MTINKWMHFFHAGCVIMSLLYPLQLCTLKLSQWRGRYQGYLLQPCGASFPSVQGTGQVLCLSWRGKEDMRAFVRSYYMARDVIPRGAWLVSPMTQYFFALTLYMATLSKVNCQAFKAFFFYRDQIALCPYCFEGDPAQKRHE